MLFYLSSILQKFNFLNKQLQGKNSTLLDVKQKISSFVFSIKLIQFNVKNNSYSDFQNLIYLNISDNVKNIILNRLEMIIIDFIDRFHDLKNLNIPNGCCVHLKRIFLFKKSIKIRSFRNIK
ncbi:hypothetical protein DMUE_3050 [Dictyocoela muelleri]|nr:hypothetical protein DMUE_3050 [Dictyocoela muelleri]